MRRHPSLPTFAFVGWNPFQIRHALPVARALPGSFLLVEKRKRHLLRFREDMLDGTHAPSMVWQAGALHELDGVFDVLVCQTYFKGLERFEQSKIAMLQYGLAKEPHNYGDWRALADLVLTYGPYSDARIRPYAPTAMVGTPAYDLHDDESQVTALKRVWNLRLDPSRATLLYAPTWGALSTSESYIDAVSSLASRYNVILKLHHNTSLLDPRRRRLLQRESVHMLGESDDLQEALVVADVVLSDYSGAIFDGIYARKRVLLLQQGSQERFGEKLSATSLEYARRTELGRVVKSPAQVQQAVEESLRCPQLPSAELLSELFLRKPGASERAAHALRQLAVGDGPHPTADHLAQRQVVRARLAASADHQRSRGASGRSRWLTRGAQSRRPTAPQSPVAPTALATTASAEAIQERGPRSGFASLVTRGKEGLVQWGRRSASAAFQKLRGSVVGRLCVDRSRQRLASELFARVPGLSAPVAGFAFWLRQEGRHDDAMRVLQLAQRGQPGEAALLLCIADGYRDDAKPASALPFYRAAAVVRPVYGSLRLLAFESDHGLLRSGRQTLARVLAADPEALLPHLSIFNRVAGLYPDADADLKAMRIAQRSALHRDALASRAVFVARVRAGLAGRFLQDVDLLLQRGREAGHVLPRDLEQRIEDISNGLAALRPLIELAWWNEHADGLICVHGGSPKALPADATTVVEFFIPGAFFAHDAAEKATYQTVRQFWLACFAILQQREGVHLVPRLQNNWRSVRQRTAGLCLSYHTHGTAETAQLRVQETPLSGRCSLDARGYAGFSSLAIGPVSAVFDRPTEAEVENTRAALWRELVETNTSKYPQSQSSAADALPAQYVFVPLQLRNDEVAGLAYIEMLTMLQIVVSTLANTRTAVVVKRHPFCASASIAAELRRLSEAGLIVLSTDSVHRLIASASAVVTVNSGVGLESLVHDKPVIVTGGADYASAATVCFTAGQLEAALLRLEVSAKSARFLHYYVNHFATQPEAKRLQRALVQWLESASKEAQGAQPLL